MWDLTPREFFREVVACRDREIALVNSQRTQAWLTANWSRAAKLPDLAGQLIQKAPRQQSVGEMKAMVQLISEHFKIPLRKGKRH